MGASKLLKRPNSTLWSPVQRANQEDPEAENSKDTNEGPQTQDPFLPDSHENKQVPSFAHAPSRGEEIESAS